MTPATLGVSLYDNRSHSSLLVRSRRAVRGSVRRSRMVPRARLENVGTGLAPITEGWFVANARDAAWLKRVLVIEDEEVPLRAWDVVRCPPGTAHAFVGAGE